MKLTTVNGRIIFTETTQPPPPDTSYSRWISVGHGISGPPEYSIQRFTYRHDERPRRGYIEVPPYYRVYNFGFRLADGKGEEEFDTFEAACKVADQNHIDTGASS